MLSVIPGVKRNVTPGLSGRSDYIQRLVAVERGNLDGNDVLDFGELPPKPVGKHPAAHGWLQVEAKDGENASNLPAMSDQRRVVQVLCGRQTQEASAIAQVFEETRL